MENVLSRVMNNREQAMSKYWEVDDAILKSLENQEKYCTPANNFSIEMLVREINPNCVAWRVIDRRTQALKKANKIRLNRKRQWELVRKERSEG